MKRLAFSFSALACVPFILVLRGAPSLPETLVFASSLAPLAAAMVAARTGRLVLAHAIVMLGLTCLGVTLWLGLGCGAICVVPWLLAAHAEASAGGDTTLSRLMGVVILAVLAGILAVPEAKLAATQSILTCILVSGLALVYASIVHAEWWRSDRDEPTEEGDAPIWRAISETMDDVVLVFDKTGSVLRTRMDSEARLGVSSHDLMGRGFFEHVAVGDRPAFLSALAAVATDDTTFVAIIRLQTSRSVAKQIEIRARRLACSNDGGGPARIVAILRAVEPRVAESTVDAPVLHDDVQPKQRLSANMRHELRTPLNAIIGFSEILASRTLRPADVAKQQDYARIINQSGHHLLSVVNTILDTPKVPAGSSSITTELDASPNFSEQRMMQVA